jgi:hypothetical protein
MRKEAFRRLTDAQAAQVTTGMAGLRYSMHQPAPRVPPSMYMGLAPEAVGGGGGHRRSTPYMPSTTRPGGAPRSRVQFCDSSVRDDSEDWRLTHKPLTHETLDDLMRWVLHLLEAKL